jgi:hypothetical protein
MSEERLPRWARLFILALLVVLGVYLRVRLSTSTPRFDAADGTGYFRAESAFQYRYARMLAMDQEIPELDRSAQHPEGLRPRAELTLLMERLTAAAWKVLGLESGFHRFVMLWTALFSCLSIPAIYLLTGSLPAAALYGLSWTAASSVAGAYGFQSFALPLIHLSLAFLALSLSKRPAWALASGLCLAAALAGWHFTRFYFGTLVLALAYAAWRENDLRRLRFAVTVLMACAATAGVAVESLRETRFLLSPSMILGYALAFALHFPKKGKWIAGAAAGVLALMTFSIPDGGAYGHVYGLLFEKLRHGLAKPRDPGELNFHARLLWNGPFNSPDLGALLFALLPAALILGLRSGARPTAAGRLLDVLALIYAGGTALVSRLSPFFLSFLIAGSALKVPAGRLNYALAGLAGLELLKSLAPSSPWNPAMALSSFLASKTEAPLASFAHERELIEWLRANASGVPVLAHYGLSASLLTYADVPVVLHPKFETAAIRVKTAAYLSALYSDEAALLAFAEKHRASIVVHSADLILDDTSDGARYASGSLRLTPKSPAVLMHFQPEKLQGLRLVFQNPDYRVFAVGAEKMPRAEVLPIYDLSQYQPRVEPDGSLTLNVRSVNERVRQARLLLMKARLLARLGHPERALRTYNDSFLTWPPDAAAAAEAKRLAESLPPSGV